MHSWSVMTPRSRAAFGGPRQACAILFLSIASFCALAQDLKATPADIKAAYLLKLPSFVEWPTPTAADVPFVIQVVDADDVAHALAELGRGIKVMGRPVKVTRLSKDEVGTAAQLVFVGASVKGKPASLAEGRADDALIVSDQPNGLAEGAALQFVEAGGRVRFEAAPANALRHGMKLSARLLSVAIKVESGTTP